VVALVLAFCGLYVVLVVENGLPLPHNTGDWFALLSGLCWSIATVKLFQDGARMVMEKVITFVVCALFMSLLLVLWQQGDLGGMPDLATLRAAWHWLLLIAVLMLPITWLTIWPATLLSPGRVGMLLLAEVLVGVSSAALLLDEPFGMRELAGAVLIVTAGVVEVMRQQKLPKSAIVESRPTP
jgi:drug/metabolite transporter (DMT)-like permease